MPATAPKSQGPTVAASGHKVRLTIALDDVPYVVRPVRGDALPFSAVRGFTFTRTDRRLGRVTHTLIEGFEGVACSCGDQTFRQTPKGGECKHLAAARAVGLF